MIDATHVAEHYDREGLIDRLRAALSAAGLEADPLTPDQLAPLDQFHSRGIAATVELARLLDPGAATRVLDLGSGLGGPSRYLAATYGCQVIGVDLSASYCEAATYLAERAGLSDRVTYVCGDALALDFADATFDLVWTQHVAMNIAERARFYREAYRVLRPGGQLAIYDVIGADGGDLVYPVPWSRTPETSFLLTAIEMRAHLSEQGFEVESWIDRTAAAIDWFTELKAQQEANIDQPHPLGLHIAMGPEFKQMTANLGRNLKEGRAGVVEAVLRRP